MPEGIVIPHTGEIVDPDDLEELVTAYKELRILRDASSDALEAMRDCLAQISAQAGSKYLETDAGSVEVTVRNQYKWRPERLESLMKMGLPKERYYEMVTMYPKVSARVAFAIAKSNPEYAATIADSHEVVERREVRVV